MKTEGYRVKVGKNVKLKNWKTDEDDGLDKSEGKAWTKALADELAHWQERLYAENKQALLIVLQARDAGGKDGTVKHVIGAFNPNGVHIANFKVPSEEELAHDFLWRIHAKTPKRGMVAVFNRSHYEDVLVTRVHDIIDDRTAQQRLDHIRNFEALLNDTGTRVLKFYLHVSKQEQEQRLQDRLDDPDKLWKFSAGDLEERALWDQHTPAYQDALTTSTVQAPWYVIPADRKWFRNVLISQIILETLKDMNPQFPETDLDPDSIKIK
ncbi:polyphosphate kinase 2 family protein [Deinococcus frigens]|uniref:polyphosphate kinase 2 family protein n=1 Tax=Deinococcus frigens TaxID=249403 RepID=UPI000A06B22D